MAYTQRRAAEWLRVGCVGDLVSMAKQVGSVYLLKRAELAVRGCVDVAFGDVDLTPSQYFILFLAKCGEASSSAGLAGPWACCRNR